jgi:hypothetical protein
VIKALALDEVSGLERRSGKHHLILAGAIVGMNAGFVIGAAATASECNDYRGSWACVGSGAPYGMLVGAVAGGAIGAMVHPDKWSRVAWPPSP